MILICSQFPRQCTSTFLHSWMWYIVKTVSISIRLIKFRKNRSFINQHSRCRKNVLYLRIWFYFILFVSFVRLENEILVSIFSWRRISLLKGYILIIQLMYVQCTMDMAILLYNGTCWLNNSHSNRLHQRNNLNITLPSAN